MFVITNTSLKSGPIVLTLRVIDDSDIYELNRGANKAIIKPNRAHHYSVYYKSNQTGNARRNLFYDDPP